MMNTMFLAPIPMIEDADQTIREIKAEIDRIARVKFGEMAQVMISLHPDGHWSVMTLAKPFVSTYGEGLVDALHAFKAVLDAAPQPWTSNQVAATLGIEAAQ